jgi:hypothetical protein
LTLAGGDHSVTGNKLGEDSTGGFNTEGKRADIDEDETRGSLSSRENTTLDGSAVGNSFIGVDALGRLFATEELFQELLDLGDTSRTTDENDLYNSVSPRFMKLACHH